MNYMLMIVFYYFCFILSVLILNLYIVMIFEFKLINFIIYKEN